MRGKPSPRLPRCVQGPARPAATLSTLQRLRKALVLAIPTGFDVVATALMNVGLLHLRVSVYQMMRGASELLFARLFAAVVLKRRRDRHGWLGLYDFLGAGGPLPCSCCMHACGPPAAAVMLWLQQCVKITAPVALRLNGGGWSATGHGVLRLLRTLQAQRAAHGGHGVLGGGHGARCICQHPWR